MNFLLNLIGGAAGPYIMGALAVLFAGALATTTVQTYRLDHAKADLTTARAALVDPVTKRKWQAVAVEERVRLQVCEGNSQRLDGALTLQNAAVGRWKAEADRVSAAGLKALTSARKDTQAAERRAATIMASAPGPDQCASAETLIRETIR